MTLLCRYDDLNVDVSMLRLRLRCDVFAGGNGGFELICKILSDRPMPLLLLSTSPVEFGVDECVEPDEIDSLFNGFVIAIAVVSI